MKLIDSLAADYWIENTKRIYEEDLHISTPVMDAYKAGFEKATIAAMNKVHNAQRLGFIHGDYFTLISAIESSLREEESI